MVYWTGFRSRRTSGGKLYQADPETFRGFESHPLRHWGDPRVAPSFCSLPKFASPDKENLYSAVQIMHICMMTGETGGFRLDLGEPTAGMLADFCTAFFGANKTQVIREALQEFIPVKVAANPERGTVYLSLQANRKGEMSSE